MPMKRRMSSGAGTSSLRMTRGHSSNTIDLTSSNDTPCTARGSLPCSIIHHLTLPGLSMQELGKLLFATFDLSSADGDRPCAYRPKRFGPCGNVRSLYSQRPYSSSAVTAALPACSSPLISSAPDSSSRSSGSSNASASISMPSGSVSSIFRSSTLLSVSC